MTAERLTVLRYSVTRYRRAVADAHDNLTINDGK